MTRLSAKEFIEEYGENNRISQLLRSGINPDIKRAVLASPKFHHFYIEWFIAPEFIDCYCSTECKYFAQGTTIYVELKEVVFYQSLAELEEYRKVAIANDFAPRPADLSRN